MLCSELHFLTANKHKLEEARRILKPYGITVKPCTQFQKVEIQAGTPKEVVEFAAKFILMPRKLSPFLRDEELPCIVIEDFAFYVNALNGFPGTYANQFYRALGNQGLLKLLEGKKDRRARYAVAVALLYTAPDGTETYRIFEAETAGTVSPEERGTNGFAYDRIFSPEGETRTFAEMEPEEKDEHSPRAKALKKLANFVNYQFERVSSFS